MDRDQRCKQRQITIPNSAPGPQGKRASNFEMGLCPGSRGGADRWRELYARADCFRSVTIPKKFLFDGGAKPSCWYDVGSLEISGFLWIPGGGSGRNQPSQGAWLCCLRKYGNNGRLHSHWLPNYDQRWNGQFCNATQSPYLINCYCISW